MGGNDELSRPSSNMESNMQSISGQHQDLPLGRCLFPTFLKAITNILGLFD